MATVCTPDAEPFESEPAYQRLKDQALVELAWAVRDMAGYLRDSDPVERVAKQVYIDLADAATLLRLVRHGSDRLLERREERRW